MRRGIAAFVLLATATGVMAVPTASFASPGDSPAPSTSFAGVLDGNTVSPPDTDGAVGPNHVLTVVNGMFQVQNRNGTVLSSKTLGAFWKPLVTSAFDPHSFYDPYAGRFVVVSAAANRSASSAILIAATGTGDPTGAWYRTKIDADPTDTVWADYPMIGFNSKWVVVSLNMFTVSGSSFDHSEIYAFDRTSLYAGGTPAYTKFTLDFEFFGTIVPALTYDPSNETEYFLQNYYGPYGLLREFALTGPVGAATFSTVGPDDGFITAPDTWGDIPPGDADFAPQAGTGAKVDTGDARLQDVVYRNGALWTSHVAFLPTSAPTHSAAQWWQIDPATHAILQNGRVDDPSATNFYAFPSIAVDANDDALLGFTAFSASTYPSAAYAYREHSDATNTMRAPYVMHAGVAPYNKPSPTTGQNRWGDFSVTTIDPSDDQTLWTIQEYASTPVAGSDRWGTWWGQVSSPAVPPTFALSMPSTSVDEGAATASITVRRTGSTDPDVYVDWATIAGTATGADFTPGSGTLHFASGEIAQTITVPITDDLIAEMNETFTVSLSNPNGGALGAPTTETVTIKDNEAPTLQFSAASASTTESGGARTIKVTRLGQTTPVVGVDYASADGTATNGVDYTAASGTLSFASGVTSKTFVLPVIQDGVAEQTETLTLNLSHPTGGASLGSTPTQTFSIKDDEAPTFVYSASSYDVGEAGTSIMITVRRLGLLSSAASVEYTTADGTAAHPSDYTASALATLSFSANNASKTFKVTIKNDTMHEANETVNLGLQNASAGAVIGAPATATLTIVDNDP